MLTVVGNYFYVIGELNATVSAFAYGSEGIGAALQEPLSTLSPKQVPAHVC
jgi:hypothetical protein